MNPNAAASSKQDHVSYHDVFKNSYPLSSDLEWPASDDWFLSRASAESSLASSSIPSGPLSAPPGWLAPGATQDSYFIPNRGFYQPQYSPLPVPLHYRLVQDDSRPRFSRPQTQLPPKDKRAPRPANAFMLFRSDFLKKGIIPSHVERRQQNLSRIAGECWNMMSPEEKKEWHYKAEKALEDHQRQYPGYKFTPVPKRVGRTRTKVLPADGEGIEQKSRIRELRETYIPMMSGPAVTPPRRRKNKAQPRDLAEDEMFATAIRMPLPPSIPPSPAPSESAICESMLPGSLYSFSPYLETCRPLTPHNDQPQQQTESNNEAYAQRPCDLSRPPSAASSDGGLITRMQDLDITPTATNFGSISMPGAFEYTSDYSSALYSMDSALGVETALGLRQLQLPFDCATDSSASSQPFPSLDLSCQQVEDVNTGLNSLLPFYWSDDNLPPVPNYNTSPPFLADLENTLNPESTNHSPEDLHNFGSFSQGAGPRPQTPQ